jgi:murein peptide amidase A
MPSSILHQSSWAQTSLGNPIQLFSSPEDGAERPLLFVGGVHGDEPEGVELAEKILSWLQKNHKENFYPWLLIPCLNVDGYRSKERTNANGVDLNRNFPSEDWSPLAKAPRYFPGTGPASEPEVSALCQLIGDKKPQVIVHFHSWEPCVVYTGAIGRSWAEKAAMGTGYEVREDIGYPTPGSLGQYGWLNCKVPVICIEEKEGTAIETVWPRFADGLKALVNR